MDQKILFVIPARSGSKGIKNKNLQYCGGETLLRRAVKNCLEMDFNKRIIVSTDDYTYLKHVEDICLINNFLRPDYLSGDRVGDVEVLIHALHTSEVVYKEKYNCIVMIQPTCPLRLKSHIEETIDAVINKNWNSSFTAHAVDLKYHPLKALIKNNDNSCSLFLPEGRNIISRQQLSATYIRNGASYAIKPSYLCTKKSLICDQETKIIETTKLISIDNQSELKTCEKILNSR